MPSPLTKMILLIEICFLTLICRATQLTGCYMMGTLIVKGLRNKVTSCGQQMGHVMCKFGNINHKTELEVKVSLLEKEYFELRVQLVDQLLIIKHLKTNSKSNPFTTDASTTAK